MRRTLTLMAAVLAALNILAACDVGSAPTADPSSSPSRDEATGDDQIGELPDDVATAGGKGPEAIRSTESAQIARGTGTLDATLSFWAAAAGIESAREAERFSDLSEMTNSANAVIVGRITGRVTGPTITDPDEPSEAAVTLTGFEVEVVELLAGELPVGGGKVVLTTLFSPESYSSEPVMMFLRWRGQPYEDGWGNAPADFEAWDRATYRLVSTQGLFVATPEGVANPVSEKSFGYLDGDVASLADPVARGAAGMSFEELRTFVLSIARY